MKYPSRILFYLAIVSLAIVWFATRDAAKEEFTRARDEARVVREQKYQRIFALRTWFLASLDRTIPQPVAALMGGILVGERTALPKAITEDFRRTGLSHIMAISGYNISIIAVMLMGILASLVSRRRAFWLVLAILGVFMILTGLQASVIRATIMGVLALLAQHVGRMPTPLHALTITAAVMVLLDPLILRFDIGFQLSVLATLGILLLVPRLEERFTALRHFGPFGEAAITTVSAQLFVLPLVLYYFKTFSLVSLPANILVLPMLPPLMLLGFLAGLTAWIPLVGTAIGFLAWSLGSILLWVVHWFASLPWASISL